MLEVLLLIFICFFSCLRITMISVIYDGKLKRDRLYISMLIAIITGILIYVAMRKSANSDTMVIIYRALSVLFIFLNVKIYIKKDIFKNFLYVYATTLFMLPIDLSVFMINMNGDLLISQFVAIFTEVLITIALVYILFKRQNSSISQAYKFALSKIYYAAIIFPLMDTVHFIISIIRNKEFLQTELIIFIVLLNLVLIAAFVFALLKENKQSNHIKNQADLLRTYTETIEYLYEDIRIYKHDINNILLSLKYYIDEKDYESVNRVFYDDIYGIDAFDIKVYKLLAQLKDLKVEVLKGLILAKYKYALSLGVDFEIAIPTVIEKIDVNEIDICRIMGIYIDNAIESASETDDKEVLIYFDKVDSEYLMKISNSYSHMDMPIKVKKNYSTKGKGRGLGLYSAETLLKKNKNMRNETILDTKYYNQYVYISI